MTPPRLLLVAALAGCLPPDDDQGWTPDTDVADTDVVDTDIVDTDPGGPIDALLALGQPVIDPEFWADPALVAWQHPTTSRVWVAEVDATTGQWSPDDGKGLALGTASPIAGDADHPATFNGPEWGDDGRSIFFTAPADDGSNQIVVYARGAGELRTVTAGDGIHRSGAIPQRTAGPGGLAVYYFLGPIADLTFAWRRVEGDDVDHVFPASSSSDPTPRWIPGEDALAVLVDDGDGLPQVARYALDGGTITPMTDDEGAKTDPFVIDDPAGGGRLLVVSVADSVPELGALVPGRVAVYREGVDGWTREHTFGVEDVLGGEPRAIVSLEPFVLDGEAWVSFVATTGRDRGSPAHVFVARADGSTVIQLTEGDASRTDPEVVVLGGVPFVVYTERDGAMITARVVRDFLPDGG